MATPIEDGTIGGDLKAYADQIYTAKAIPNSTTSLSDAFLLGQTMAGVEIKVVCNVGATLIGTGLLIELQTAETETGTYKTAVSKTVPTGAIVAGDVLAGLILPREESGRLYTKLKMTTTAAQATGSVDAYPVLVS